MGPDLQIGDGASATWVPGGITYGDLEVLQIDLGSGFNDFTVLGTHTRSDGYQTWTFLNTGDDILDANQPGRTGDTIRVNLDAAPIVTGPTSVVAASNPTPNSFATLVAAPNTFTYLDGGITKTLDLRGQLVEIAANTTGQGQQRRILANTNDTLYVDRAWEILPTATPASGDLASTFEIMNERDGAFAVCPRHARTSRPPSPTHPQRNSNSRT